MKINRLFLILLLCFFTAFNVFLPLGAIGVNAQDFEGRTFTEEDMIYLSKPLESTPKTYEAWIKLSPSVTGSGGVIFGNYKTASEPFISFEIYEKGKPYIFYRTKNGMDSILFNSVDVRSDEFVHLAITWDESTAKCYLNGEQCAQIYAEYVDFDLSTALCLGSDLREGNTNYFKGNIKQVVAFNDVRTEDEIKSDMQSLSLDDSNMAFAFNLENGTSSYKDLSNNGFDTTPTWFGSESVYIPENYAFSFMAIGDTQRVAELYPDKMHYIYDYVLDNVESKKVKYVIGLGDITEHDLPYEWEAAERQISRLNGKVPYSIVRGNHDTSGVEYDMTKLTNFDQLFGSENSEYAKQYTYCYEGESKAFRARNTVHFFTAGNHDYMIVSLDFGANDGVLKWASEIISNHPNHNVIVTTHAYLDKEANFIDNYDNANPKAYDDIYNNGTYGLNNGDELWEKFVKKHKNIVMVLSGHSSHHQIMLKQSKGENGNVVSQFMIDGTVLDNQEGGPAGMVATFYVSENGEDITVEWYSTVKQQYYKKSNNFSFKVNVIERGEQTNSPSFLLIGAISLGVLAICGIVAFILIKKKRAK
ncbi:MAG: hypothetical protein E7358_04845 [Clostridiales bacterium]|nr:hypothetical protein [Clostridiales bacterium]